MFCIKQIAGYWSLIYNVNKTTQSITILILTSSKNWIGAWHVSSVKSTKAAAIVLKKLGSIKYLFNNFFE